LLNCTSTNHWHDVVYEQIPRHRRRTSVTDQQPAISYPVDVNLQWMNHSQRCRTKIRRSHWKPRLPRHRRSQIIVDTIRHRSQTLTGYRGGSPTAVQAWHPALCGSRHLLTPYYCKLGDLLRFVFMPAYCMFDLSVYYLFLQYFDTVDWVFW